MREGRVAASVCFQPKRAEEKSPDDSAYRVGPGLMLPPAWFFHPDVGRGFDDRSDLFFIYKGESHESRQYSRGVAPDGRRRLVGLFVELEVRGRIGRRRDGYDAVRGFDRHAVEQESASRIARPGVSRQADCGWRQIAKAAALSRRCPDPKRAKKNRRTIPAYRSGPV